jgi:hypothetical protein
LAGIDRRGRRLFIAIPGRKEIRMKLTTNKWLRDGRWMGLCRMAMVPIIMVVSIIIAIGTAAYAQSVSTTTVQGTVYLANGQPGSGTLSVSWPAFTTASGQAVAADQMTVTIGSDGYLSVNLAPNLGATPAGLFYTVVYYLSDGTTSTEYWVVPAAAQATLGSVRAQLMPAAQAVQAVSKAYVDEAISELTESGLTATGGTLTGPLYLSGDPTQALQAADKHYVDESAALAVPLAGGAMTGALTGPSITSKQLGGTYQADQFSGADFGAKLQACLSSLSATSGGTCDARNFTGSQSMGSILTISTGNATVLLPCATIATANQVIVTAGTRNVALRGCALRGGSSATGSQGGTVFEYSGSGAMVQVGDPTYAQDTLGFHMDNAVINTTATASATAHGLVAYRTQEMDLESLYLLGNSNQTGMTLDGTGNYTGGTFFDNEISGFQTAVNAIGHQVTNSATTDWVNGSTFVRLHIDCPTSGGSPISGSYGINLQQGDGNTFTGGDVEGCSTAMHLGANAQNNTIVGLRNENSTNQVVADTGSSYNSWMTGGTMFTGQLTDNGTRNSFLDTFHRSFNGIKGDWYGSQQDATVTNHYRIGIGAGNERGLVDRYQTDYGYRWTMGLSDATAGEQFYQILDELNNVYRISIGQYNNGQSSTNNQTVINAAGTGAVVLNGSNNSGSGGVVFGSGGASETTVATINNAGNAQFNGTLQVGGSSTFTGSTTVKNQSDAEIDATLWAGLTTSQKESYIYKDWNGNSQWYMVKDASNNWAVNSATGGLDSFKAYQSTNSGDTYINTSNTSGVVRINYETGSGTQFKVYGGNSSTLYASYTGTTSIQFPGLAASSGYFCLQIDNSGYITNTGAACGSGSGSGSGTVNSGTAGQIASYSTTGTAVTGITSIPISAGGTGATTAASALTSLGAAPLASPAFTGTPTVPGYETTTAAALLAPLASPTFTGTVTASAFSGSLTGHASLDLPLTGGALTGPVTNTSTIAAAGLQDTNLPVVDTFTVSSGYNPASPVTGAAGGGGADECAKLMQLSYNADQAGYLGNVFRSNSSATAGAANVITCTVAGFFDPYLTTPVSGLLPLNASGGKTILSPGTTYIMPGEVDIAAGYTLDGQSTYGNLGTNATSTWLKPGSAYPLVPPSTAPGTVFVNLGPQSTSNSAWTLGSVVKDLSINCSGAPGMTGAFNGYGQQFSGYQHVRMSGCDRGLYVGNMGTSGAQNHGMLLDVSTFAKNPQTTQVVNNALITAGGSYTQAPAVTITGCSTTPTATAVLTGTAVTSLSFSGPNYYGAGCNAATASVSFGATYGSGAAAIPIVQMMPISVGNQSKGSGGGMYITTEASAGNYAIEPTYGFQLDGSGEFLYDTYAESMWEGLRVGGVSSTAIGSNIAFGVRTNPANGPCLTSLDIASTSQAIYSFTGGAIGGRCAYHITDEQPNGGNIRYSAWNNMAVALYVRERNSVISSNSQIVTNIPIGTSYNSCGAACTLNTKAYLYVPAKNVGGYATSMSLSDTAQPIGIFSNGSVEYSNTKTTTAATTGAVSCLFDPSVTVTAGDYVGVSANTVVSGYSVAGCLDLGSTLPIAGWIIGRVVYDGANGSTAALSTPSAPTVTSSATPAAITYSYELVAATYIDQTKSTPSTAGSLTTGPASIGHGGSIALSFASGLYDIYRTAIGSTMPSGLTVECCTSGQVTGVAGFPSGSGISFAPTGTFSGGGCSTEPYATWEVAGGQVLGPVFQTYGVGCTSAPTITWTHSTYDTGWIGQTTGASYTDTGRPGDGSTPAAGGQIAPRVALAIQQGIPPTLSNPMTTAGDTIYGVSAGAPTRLPLGTAGQVLTVNPGATAPIWGAPGILTSMPAWLTNLGTGADGAETCAGNLSGDYYYTTFNVASSTTCTVNANIGLTIHATGACTINGTINASAVASGLYPWGAGSGGSGGGGTAASLVGTPSYVTPGTITNYFVAGGAVSAASGGAGNAGNTLSTSQQRQMYTSAGTLDGQDLYGALGSNGGSSGGTHGFGGVGVTLICASITGTGTINASGGAGSNSAANSTGAGGGAGGGVILLSSQAAETFGLTLNVAGGAGGTCGSYTTCGAGGQGGNGWTAEFQGW